LQKKILLIDDIDFVLNLEKELFNEIQKESALTFAIETASSVSEALAHLDNTVYDLLITDMNLPDGNGSEIAKAAAEKSSGKTTLVALTSMPIAFEESKELFDTYLTKPTSPRDIKKHFLKLVSSLSSITRERESS